ncbi:MAG: hypothetical protein R3315_09360 [Woeseiaceae bacterium]|nr:hypothetical protein [Woeseiaceae bacterium]
MKIITIAIALTAATLIFSAPAASQDNETGFITVRSTVVRTEHMGEYTELLAKLADSRKAAGLNGRNVWQVVRGPVSTFYIVTAHDSMAEAGEPFDSGMSDADWQRWVGRITSVIDHSTLTTLRTHPSLAISADADAPPNMMLLRYTTLKPGYNQAYQTWVGEKLVPALAEGGLKGWTISKVMYGDNPNTWISARRIDSWEQLDEPNPLAYMSERRRDALLGEARDMLAANRLELIRHRPELSY